MKNPRLSELRIGNCTSLRLCHFPNLNHVCDNLVILTLTSTFQIAGVTDKKNRILHQLTCRISHSQQCFNHPNQLARFFSSLCETGGTGKYNQLFLFMDHIRLCGQELLGIRKELLELCTETAQKFLVPWWKEYELQKKHWKLMACDRR